MKLLFISPRPFGLMGTPGTYHLVEAYARNFPTRVIASSRGGSNVEIVYEPSDELDLHEVAFGEPGYAREIARIAKEFGPDIVCLGNYHHWYEIVERVKKDLPNAKYVLDIKSPLIGEDNSRRKMMIQDQGAQHEHLLDLVITRCMEDVTSWIPGCTTPVSIYPLGVKLSQFAPRSLSTDLVKCSRFVFVGSYSINRKLHLLLEFLSKLPQEYKQAISVDMFGSGPEKDNLLGLVTSLDLTDVVTIYDSLSQDELLKRLPTYDAGIGWVPREIYDAAPSLKVLEYLGSGLVPIISSTTGHRRNLEEGFHAILFDETVESFCSAIIQACSEGFRKEDIEKNLALIAKRDWDEVVANYLRPAFCQLIGQGTASNAPLVETGFLESRNSEAPVRILMISPRPFGLMGTQGTYHLAEAFSGSAEVCVIANRATTQAVNVVYRPGDSLNVREIGFKTRRYLDEISDIAKQFRPNIVWMGNYSHWPEVISRLKSECPETKFILDIKSPLLTGDDQASRKAFQLAGIEHASQLDRVVALSEEDVHTWIPGYSGSIQLYPLGIKRSLHSPKTIPGGIVKPKRFVFVGSYQAARKLDKLLAFIAGLPFTLRDQISLDMYGDGPAGEELRCMVEDSNLQGTVTIHDALEHHEMLRLLPTFDAGIAWVPHELYENAPSIKFLEYAASGLMVLATDTLGHKGNIAKGFDAILFSENQESFNGAIHTLVEEGVDSEKLKNNLQVIENFDWDRIVRNLFLPEFLRLFTRNNSPSSRETTRPVSAESKVPAKPVQHEAYWTPAVVPFHSTRKGNAELTVLGIVSERLYYGLRPECNLLPLPKVDWQSTFEATSADFLLIESCLFSVLGDWRYDLGPELSDDVGNLLAMAKQRGMPSVLWLTVDVSYHQIYAKVLERFDLVCVSDPRMSERLREHGVEALYLPPAIQPRLFNPLRPLSSCQVDFTANLVSGTGLIETSDAIRQVVEGCSALSFTGFERTHVPTTNYLNRIGRIAGNYSVRGKVSHRMLPEVLKNSRIMLTDAAARITDTEAAWQAVENAACMCLTLRLGESAQHPIAKKFTQTFSSSSSLVEYLTEHGSDSISLGEERLLQWRQAFRDDTFEQRFGLIVSALGLPMRPTQSPVASIVTPTMRADRVERVLENFERQEHSQKELIVVVNGSVADYEAVQHYLENRPDVKVLLMPRDQYAASTLNLGMKYCEGDFFFRFDDDDYYGKHYVSDTFEILKADAAGFVGKYGSFVKVVGRDDVYIRRQANSSRVLRSFTAADFSDDEAGISGATFCINLNLLREHPFPDRSLATADSALLERLRTECPTERVIKSDWYNYTIGREEDSAGHTWRVGLQELVDQSKVVLDEVSEVPR